MPTSPSHSSIKTFFFTIFQDFFEFFVFLFRRFYAQIKNVHKNRPMETQLLSYDTELGQTVSSGTELHHSMDS